MKKLIRWLKSMPWKDAAAAAIKVLLPAAVGAGAAIFAGCSSLTPSAKTQTMGVYAFGIPGIAVITQSAQNADNAGDDDNKPMQVNPVTVKPNIGK